MIGDAGWVVLIDPRGVSGEVEYDLAVVALKATRFVPLAVILTNLASLVGVDQHRVEVWTVVASAARV